MEPGTEAAPRAMGLRAGFGAPFVDPAVSRSWTIEANDGIIATAGLLQGFAGAGASDRILVFTASAAAIAGGLAVAGAAWAELAAERDAQLLAVAEEQHALAVDPEGEVAALADHWVERGLTPHLARQVAEQLSARDALTAQLEWEHGFTEPMRAGHAVMYGLGAGLSYVAGALVPLLITYLAPVAIETWAILVAVTMSLCLSAVVAARAGDMVPRRVLARTLVVGGLTMAISYAAGELLL